MIPGDGDGASSIVGPWIQQRHMEDQALKALDLEKMFPEQWVSKYGSAPTVSTPPKNCIVRTAIFRTEEGSVSKGLGA